MPPTRQELMLARSAGAGQTRITVAEETYEQEPSWSPDGERVAFFSRRDGHADLWVMHKDGRGQRRLTFD